MPEILDIGDLSLEIRRSAKRKTITITVDRGGQMVINAPQVCARHTLRAVVEKKKQWIYTKLLEKEEHTLQTPLVREFVTGEGFFYLGKSYRLKIIDPDPNEAYTPALRFFQGRFLLDRGERRRGREHFIQWYALQSQIWIESHAPALAQRLGVGVMPITIMDLGYRWASYSATRLNFHWRAAMLPARVLEYLVLHELIHQIEPNHGDAFWRYIEQVMPDWLTQKEWLAKNGNIFSL